MATKPQRLTGSPDSKARRHRVLSGSIHSVEDRRKLTTVRLNADERMAVKLAAERLGIEQASWIRAAIFSQLPKGLLAEAKRLVHQPSARGSSDPDVTAL